MNTTESSLHLHYKKLGLKLKRTKASVESIFADLEGGQLDPKQREVLSAVIVVLQNLSEHTARAQVFLSIKNKQEVCK